jgi:hypothetical protein
MDLLVIVNNFPFLILQGFFGLGSFGGTPARAQPSFSVLFSAR